MASTTTRGMDGGEVNSSDAMSAQSTGAGVFESSPPVNATVHVKKMGKLGRPKAKKQVNDVANAPSAEPKDEGAARGFLEAGEDVFNLLTGRKHSGKHRFIFFKYTCCLSWVIITAAFVMFILALVCIGKLQEIRDELCAEPELNTTLQACRGTLKAYADCLDKQNPLSSREMRRCFLLSPDTEYVDAVFRSFSLTQRYENETLAFGLAKNLLLQEQALEEGSGRRALKQLTMSDTKAWQTAQFPFRPRVLRNDTLALDGYWASLTFANTIEDGTRFVFLPFASNCSGHVANHVAHGVVQGSVSEVNFRLASPGLLRLCICSNPAQAHDKTGEGYCAGRWEPVKANRTGDNEDNEDASSSSLAYIGVRGNLYDVPTPDADGLPVRVERSLQSAGTIVEAGQALDSAYNLLAGSSIIVLIAAGMLEYLYVWVALFGVLGMVGSCLALYGLGNRPPRCFQNPKSLERMHKVALRCSCHLGWLLGTCVLLFSGLVITKYQVLLEYADNVNYLASIPSKWGVSSAWACTIPCFFGIFVGMAPVFSAMLISRSRAERREALESHLDQVIRRERKPGHLTGPQRIYTGTPPNLATLNPVLERV